MLPHGLVVLLLDRLTAWEFQVRVVEKEFDKYCGQLSLEAWTRVWEDPGLLYQPSLAICTSLMGVRCVARQLESQLSHVTKSIHLIKSAPGSYPIYSSCAIPHMT